MSKEQPTTVKDIYNLPGDEHGELIDGVFYQMPTPGRIHQQILGELLFVIHNYLKKKPCSGAMSMYPFPVELYKGKQILVEPDILVVCDRSKLTDRCCKGAPDWIIEIVSPGSRRLDYHIKLFKYHSSGVREYWIVDFEKNRITVHNLQLEETIEYSFAESVKSGIYNDLYIDFAQIKETL